MIRGAMPEAGRGSSASKRSVVRRCAWGFGLALVLGLGRAEGADPGPIGPDEFRAAFLSKIPPLISWPETGLGDGDRELVIAILGEAAFQPLLEALVQAMRVEDRPVVVRTVAQIEDLPRCQVLFVPAARSEELVRLPAARREGLLTVGETERFTALGGVARLEPTLRQMSIHIRNARAARLEISARLLRIAKVER
jgi:hypothetical protein